MGIFFSLSKMFQRSRGQRPPATLRLVLEPLEDRMCPSYSTIDLGTLGGTVSDARAVNTSGQVVGLSYTAGGTQQNQHAFLWQNGTMTDLGTLGGSNSFAGDINTGGEIVGASRTTAGSTVSHAYLWTPMTANGTSGSMTDLGTLGGTLSFANAINNHGQIVGGSQIAGDGATHAFVWQNGVMYDLDALLPANSGWVTQFSGIDINDNGQIAGSGLFNGLKRAFLITDPDGNFANGVATITNLGTLGGSVQAEAAGINASGQVVGWSGNTPHAVRYSGGVVTDLKTLFGYTSYANAINDTGQIVGHSSTTGSVNHAFLWQNGKMTDLNKQLPRGSAWVLESAFDINGAGQIVGQGSIGGQGHAFLMVPGAALQAQSVSTVAVTETISMGQVQSLLGEAIARWQAAGVDTAGLGNLQVHIADLGGTTLGLASGNTIYLDNNAAGWGWFVDATPWENSEFTTPGNQGEQNRMDLLTVLEHELGHLLGQEHEADGVMVETLSAGTRKTPLVDATDWLAAVDLIFSETSAHKRRR